MTRRLLVLFGKSCAAALAVIAVGMMLLGIPGAILLGLATTLIGEPGAIERMGDGAWPAAIMVSVLAPLAIVPINMGVALRRPQWSRWRHGAAVSGLTLLIGLGVALAVYDLARR